MSHEEFATRYQFLVGGPRTNDARELCRRIVQAYSKMGEEIRVGNGQIYATEHGVEMAEQWKNYVRGQAASVIQRCWREHMRRKQAALLIQCWWRRMRQDRAARKVQAWWRKKCSTLVMLSRLRRICRSVRIIQRSVRCWLHKKRSAIDLPTLSTSVLPAHVEQSLHVSVESAASSPTTAQRVCQCVSNPTSLVSLQLSRKHFFYSDGVVSIRRPNQVMDSIYQFTAYLIGL